MLSWADMDQCVSQRSTCPTSVGALLDSSEAAAPTQLKIGADTSGANHAYLQHGAHEHLLYRINVLCRQSLMHSSLSCSQLRGQAHNRHSRV